MVAHEYAHGYAALKQGDDTALSLGRLTWNPLKHIDPFMTIALPILTFVLSHGQSAFGGAKPVPVNPRLYKNFRRGDIIVSLAGIAANCALAVIFTALVAPIGLLGRAVPALGGALAVLQVMFVYGITVNLVLALFNLLPIPPLDGSHVMMHLLPASLAEWYLRVGRYGLLIVMVLVWFVPSLVTRWLAPAFAITDAAQRFVSPYLLATPWLH